MKSTVGSGELAEWLGVSAQSIAAFANDGKVVRVKRGQYDLKASIQTYTAHLREVAAHRGGETAILDLTTERARLAKEQADGQELKNRQARGELVAAADVEREWSDVLRTVRSGMLAVTSRVRTAAGLSQEQAIALDAELRLALTELGNSNEYPHGSAEGADPASESAFIAVD